MDITLTISGQQPDQVDGRSVLVDGDAELAHWISVSAQDTPDEIITIPQARLHVVADPSTLTIRAGRIVAVHAE